MADDQAPQVTEVSYDPGVLTVRWAPMTATGLTGFRVLLDDGSTQTWDVAATTYSKTIDLALDPAKTYTAAVSTLIDGAPGEQSAPLPVILLAPGMISVVYDIEPQAGLGLRWAAVNDPVVTGYSAILVEANGGATQSRNTPDTTAFFNEVLHINRGYTTSVRATAQYGIVMGPPSTPYTPVLVTPPVSALIYDTTPADQLTLRWGPTQDEAVTGYAATLREPGSGAVNTVNTDKLLAEFAKTLEAGKGYDATVRATSGDGVVQGPPSPTLHPIVPAPVLSALIYDLSPAAELTLRWGPVADDQVDGYLAVLSAPGGSPQTLTPTDTMAVFAGALDSAKTYTAQVRATADHGIVQGPASPPLSPILTAVPLDLVDYDGAATTYHWQSSANAAVVKYFAVLATTGASPQNRLTDQIEAVFDGALSVTANSSAYLRGASEDGVVQGPADSIAALITATTALTELDYDIGALTPSWTAVVQTGVTGYRIEVDGGGAPQTFDAGDVTTKTVDITLAPTSTWSVTVRPTGDRLIGPSATPLQPIVQQPGLPALYYDGAAFPFSWLGVADPNATGFEAQFYQDGVIKDDQTVAGTELSFAFEIAAGVVNTARSRAVGDKLKGPWTAIAPGPFQMNQTLDYDAYGRIKTVQTAAGDTDTYTIDAAGNVTEKAIAETGS